MYFQGITNITELQLKRIELLQNEPENAVTVNSEFMRAKDAIIGSGGKNAGQAKRGIRRIKYTVEKEQGPEPCAELRGDKVYVSLPACMIFNAQLIGNSRGIPKVATPATMAVFLPPVTPVPVFKFT